MLNETNPLSILGVFGSIFHFFSKLRHLQAMILVCTVCLIMPSIKGPVIDHFLAIGILHLTLEVCEAI